MTRLGTIIASSSGMLQNLKKWVSVPRKRLLLLLLILSIQVHMLIRIWENQSDWAPLGFLVKNGNAYVLAWKKDKEYYATKEFDNVQKAVSYAKMTLGLERARNPISELELEYLWSQERFGAYLVYWKTTQVKSLHRLTFQKEKEANYFADAFRSGAYSPSPFGHSVLFLPVKK